MSVVKGNEMGKGRRRKEVVVGVLNGEKEWQSKSVVEMACASTMGTTPLRVECVLVHHKPINNALIEKGGCDWMERVWCDMASPSYAYLLFGNEGEDDPTVFDMVNNALCVRNTMSIPRVRKMLLGVIQALKNLPRVDRNVLFIPASKRFKKKSPQRTRGERLRCRSFFWAFTELETARRSLPDGGTVFCVKGTSGKKVFR